MNYVIVRSLITEKITLTYQNFLKEVFGYDEKEAFSYLEDLLLFIEEQMIRYTFDADIIEKDVYKKSLILPYQVKIIGVFTKVDVLYKVDISLSKIELISYKLAK